MTDKSLNASANRQVLIAACKAMEQALESYRSPHQILDNLIAPEPLDTMKGWDLGRLTTSVDIVNEYVRQIRYILEKLEA